MIESLGLLQIERLFSFLSFCQVSQAKLTSELHPYYQTQITKHKTQITRHVLICNVILMHKTMPFILVVSLRFMAQAVISFHVIFFFFFSFLFFFFSQVW